MLFIEPISVFFKEQDKKAIVERFNYSIFNLINNQVGLPKDGIRAEVCLSGNQYKQIIPWNVMFDYRDYPEIGQLCHQNCMNCATMIIKSKIFFREEANLFITVVIAYQELLN